MHAEKGKVKPVHVYVGLDRSKEFHAAVLAVEGGTISPGGAAAFLGVTRQRVHALIREGKVEAWIYHEQAGREATCRDISMSDLEEYKRRNPRD